MNKNLIIWLIFLLFMPPIALAQKAAVAKYGMVASEQHLASEIGYDILKSGGNAIDAAVAMGYALAVVNPCCGNIGGGGFMTIRLASGKTVFINFRERAPLAASPDMFLDTNGKVIPNKSTTTYSAVATPGTVKGLEYVLRKYGTLERKKILLPAIKLAEHGFILGPGDVKILKNNNLVLRRNANVANIFLNKQGTYQVGDRLIQKDLANSLKLILEQGESAFYNGKIAQTIVAESKANGGRLSLKDFAEYSIQELPPVTCSYKNYQIISAPPPSSGGVTLCEMLNILEGYPLATMGYHTKASVHYIVEAMRHAFYDRNSNLGDPDFVSNPVSELVSKKYAEKIRLQIHPDLATPSTVLAKGYTQREGMQTTHYSVLDKWGNAVAVTYTIDSLFGAGIIAGHTGFLLNNEMDDFTIKPGVSNKFELLQSNNNRIEPGKRPLSSMSPTIITYNNHILMILGSPGGPRIITTTLQAILNILDYDMDIQKAIDAPRFHQQWLPEPIQIEPGALSSKVQSQLRANGYHFQPVGTWGAIEIVYQDPLTHIMYGANDRRRQAGAAIGVND
jgi:gamma-glutamyltranspeptidase / glutathione hydrolase